MKTRFAAVGLIFALASTVLAQGPAHYRDRGTGLGAIIGGLTGAAIGKNNGSTAAGAAIGVAAGALGGAALGDSMDTDVARSQALARQQLASQQYAASMSRAVRVADVISMSQANLSDVVIATHIQSVGVAERPHPNDLILMSQAGVSDAVLRAMQTAPVATAAVPPPQPVYRDRVIVEERYVVPAWPRPYPYWHHPHPPVYYPPHRGSSFHWGLSFHD